MLAPEAVALLAGPAVPFLSPMGKAEKMTFMAQALVSGHTKPSGLALLLKQQCLLSIHTWRLWLLVLPDETAQST